ncbi:LuxR family transcriptional regulator [Saccharopolyspora gloriosae]|uniref:DNA-binding CsgD family transcriptional regulator n=1 Tax=Saccharopolyspora gloriosae TaxID=455344 RepID=A0A840ND00_9PSEU|nr:LuxR family transcriptional regulator [Saccharopolyspora gloriosae]MBB5068821.1 DNA-binding CsgD family transcriptional regulator [Saccharopolyspora gloriosae]
MRTDSPLVGRDEELRLLGRLTSAAADGRGGALVLRGEPGIGKSALLDHVRRASGFLVVAASGVEFESELPFAGLHQLCLPLLGRAAETPEALRDAFGSTGAPDVFRVGLAVLELIDVAARERPVLCVIDDAHWLDHASAKVLAFVARRIAEEPVAMVFAARDGFDELPGLELGGLPETQARRLLRATLDEQVRDRILAEARGNPLALLELPEESGEPPVASSVPHRIERSFRARFAELPATARTLLVVAAAEPAGDPALVWAAAGELGIDGATAATAEASGLAEFGTRIRFCHPLARSAVLRAADAEQRHAAHRSLAAATDPVADPDRRAWHRGQSGTGPDEEVAAELESAASRAGARGGVAAAAVVLERAAALSLDPVHRTDRTFAAVRARLAAGGVDAATDLLATVDTGGLDERRRAEADLLRGRIAFASGGDGPAFMLRAALRLSEVDPALSREHHLDALEMALVVGRASGVLDAVLNGAAPAPGPPDVLDALVALETRGHLAAGPLLRAAVADDTAIAARPALAAMLAAELWDLDAHADVTGRIVRSGRASGSPMVVRLGLAQTASGAVLAGDFATAASAIAEEEAIADAAGEAPLRYPRLHLAAMRGDHEELARLGTEGDGGGQLAANLHWATALLHNGRADYRAALAAAEEATAPGDLFLAGVALPELVEAASRCGARAAAEAAAGALAERTRAGGAPWGLGVAACARALISDDEDDYREALDHLDASPAAPYRARTRLLYGESLRRRHRGLDAREHLRAAHRELTDLGMTAFADRAAAELRAAGGRITERPAPAADGLTFQERHIARHVATGATSKEVAERLFLSPRTVDAHLRNIFRKLGVTSRRRLRDLPDFRP